MPSPALDAAVARVRSVFAGMAGPDEEGCDRCHISGETALLRTPDVPLPADMVSYYMFEAPNHFADHAAAIRRLLPDFAGHLVAGRIEPAYYQMSGLARARWQNWPDDQRAAVSGFLDAWWADALASAVPSTTVERVFLACVAASSTVTPFLAHWAAQPEGGIADDHLAAVAQLWITDLLNEESVIREWHDHDRDEPLAEMQAWLYEHAPDRLAAQGADVELVLNVCLLGLPYDLRRAA